MKIYCILLDTTPEYRELKEFFDKHNLKKCT